MAENSRIEWTDHTFNPWVGCTKISPACDHCYAESWAKRTGQPSLWTGERRRTTEENWRKPLKWNRQAAESGIRAKVFCASLADVFDNQVPEEWRTDLWRLIAITKHLDWLLLTKRPQNIKKMLPELWSTAWPYWPNVWLGTTVENREESNRRIPHLLSVPAKVHFLSCEPLLQSLYLPKQDTYWHPIGWVICGGESGGHARDMKVEWARGLRNQCLEMQIPFFMKQVGSNRSGWPSGITGKGHDISQWPSDLQVRQFPHVS